MPKVAFLHRSTLYDLHPYFLRLQQVDSPILVGSTPMRMCIWLERCTLDAKETFCTEMQPVPLLLAYDPPKQGSQYALALFNDTRPERAFLHALS